MSIEKGNITIGKVYAGSVQLGEVYKGGQLINKAESEPVRLYVETVQGASVENWNSTDYTVVEDWEMLIVKDSSFGKAYGRFTTKVELIEGGNTQVLFYKSGGYGGYPMDAEEIAPAGTEVVMPFKKGRVIRLTVGASYNPNVSGQHITSSYITFVLS